MMSKPEIPISRTLSLPDLEPVHHVRRRHNQSRVLSRPLVLTQKIELTNDSAQDEAFKPQKRDETNSAIARLTVYVLNLILLVVAFPVGLAVLLFNILGGENLRTTAHVIALTGTAIALSMTPAGQAVILAF